MDDRIHAELDAFLHLVRKRSHFHAGYPYNLSCNYGALAPFFNHLLNNVGDPYVEPDFGLHSRRFEQEVLAFFADLYRLPEHESWGYVTAGGTEGNLYGISLGRELHPDGVLYASQDAHYSIAKAARLFRMPFRVVDSHPNGEMDYSHFAKLVAAERHRPAIVVVNVGTTVKGAIDDLDQVVSILDHCRIDQRYVHCDAALSGAMLPFLEHAPKIDFEQQIDSIAISAKFIGSPIPCGVVLTRKAWVQRVETAVEYIGSTDTTILGSRSGHTPMILWYALMTRGREGLARESRTCIANARYFVERLERAQVPCLRNPYSNTVVFRRPSRALVGKWQLAVFEDWAHLIVMQNIDRTKIDAFMDELIADTASPAQSSARIERFSLAG